MKTALMVAVLAMLSTTAEAGLFKKTSKGFPWDHYVHVTWTEAGEKIVPCNSQPFNPYAGTPIVVSKSVANCKGGTCTVDTVAMPTEIGAPDRLCKVPYEEKHSRIFMSTGDAAGFYTGLSTETTKDWTVAAMTRLQGRQQVADALQWSVEYRAWQGWTVEPDPGLGADLGPSVIMDSDANEALKKAILRYREKYGKDPDFVSWPDEPKNRISDEEMERAVEHR